MNMIDYTRKVVNSRRKSQEGKHGEGGGQKRVPISIGACQTTLLVEHFEEHFRERFSISRNISRNVSAVQGTFQPFKELLTDNFQGTFRSDCSPLAAVGRRTWQPSHDEFRVGEHFREHFSIPRNISRNVSAFKGTFQPFKPFREHFSLSRKVRRQFKENFVAMVYLWARSRPRLAGEHGSPVTMNSVSGSGTCQW
jgi:hypothetical protein